jgi:hypothetical protein
MIYTHVLNRDGLRVRSPLDGWPTWGHGDRQGAERAPGVWMSLRQPSESAGRARRFRRPREAPPLTNALEHFAVVLARFTALA